MWRSGCPTRLHSDVSEQLRDRLTLAPRVSLPVPKHDSLTTKVAVAGMLSTTAQLQRKNWRELWHAALDAKDPDQVLQIVQELTKVLKCEEQVRRDFREAMRAIQSSREIQR